MEEEVAEHDDRKYFPTRERPDCLWLSLTQQEYQTWLELW